MEPGNNNKAQVKKQGGQDPAGSQQFLLDLAHLDPWVAPWMEITRQWSPCKALNSLAILLKESEMLNHEADKINLKEGLMATNLFG